MLAASRRLNGGGGGFEESAPLDHLFLLPECVLSMDSAHLRQDLAGLDFSVHLLHQGPRGNVWLSGGAPVDASQHNAAQNIRPSSTKPGLHWFAHGAVEAVVPRTKQRPLYSPGCTNWFTGETVGDVYDGTAPLEQGKENGNSVSQRDREERLRLLKERQNEERQKKLEELKQQALAAQKFREQKEEERRRRIEELRLKDNDRRHQVEERKRQIWEAERDRREAILRKNQVISAEREARNETKRKNERSSIVFAFGSSTPRMLEPADTGGSYWAARRATSTSNVMMLSMSAAPPGPLTRRSSERELDGSKKRATSAGASERKPGEYVGMSTSVYEVFHWGDPTSQTFLPNFPYPAPAPFPSHQTQDPPTANGDEGDSSPTAAGVSSGRAARRKTDLMPTVPSPRDGPPRAPPRSPGRAYSMSRLDVLSQPRKVPQPPPPRDPALTRSMTHLAARPLRRGNPTSRSMVMLAPPAPPPRPTRAERLRKKAREAAKEALAGSPTGLRSGEMTPSRPQSSMSQASVHSVLSAASVNVRTRPVATPRKPRPYSIAVTGVTADRHSLSSEHRSSSTKSPSVTNSEKPPLPKVHTTKKPITPKPEPPKKQSDKFIKSAKSSASTTPKATPLQSPGVETVPLGVLGEADMTITETTTVTTTCVEAGDGTVTEQTTVVEETSVRHGEEEDGSTSNVLVVTRDVEASPLIELGAETALPYSTELSDADMTASMLAKTRITTEEEAKAALAERRRLAREQAEREAELERQRLEAERLAEEDRLRQEEEEQKRMEVETLHMIEEARKAEEERLQLAIQEAQKREEEDKKRREEEAKQKIEKEEADKKAKEEAEKQRIEMEIRLKKEEEDRQARRKRVEAIMLRTRGKGSTPTSTPTKEDGEELDESPIDELKSEGEVGLSIQDQFLHSERVHSAANTTTMTPAFKHNGHLNGVDTVVAHNNVTNSLLDLSEDTPLSGSDNTQILAPSIAPTNGKLDTDTEPMYSQPPPNLIAFTDNKKQDSAQVHDLLS